MIIQSINPNTGEIIREFESSSADDVTKAISKARETQKMWGAISISERGKHFKSLYKVLEKNVDNILNLMKKEAGKRIPDGEAEVYDVIAAIDYYGNMMESIQPDTSLKLNPEAFPNTSLMIDYVPYGVIGLIMPWNFPFYSPIIYVIAALMSGNSVVLKPSEYSTLIGLEIQNQFIEAGFPESLVEVIIGADETGKLLVKSDVDKIFFVGSIEAGKDIIANAGITPVQVELGGNSSALVLKDADIDFAVAGICWGGTYHAGQDCVGIKRVFVVEDIASEFIEKITIAVSNLRPGVDYGPYIRKEALETVKSRIDDAVNNSAKLLCGGEIIKGMEGNGFWLSPAVILHSNENLELVKNETFGNVIPVMVTKSADEAVMYANNTNYGLSNSIFTKDLELANELAVKLESGMVFINDPFIAIPGWDHWTGWKESGFGSVESKLMQCMKKKVISENKDGKSRAFWYPY